MAKPCNYLAIDLGAESGRAILGTLGEGQLALSEIHRFPNGPIRLPDGLHWDVLRLWSEIKAGLALAAGKHQVEISSIALDTWGVDYALLDDQGALLGNPYHYRDSRTDGMLEAAFRRMPREEIFAFTGIQFMQINTLYQLLSMVVSNSPQLQAASTLLTIPDLFNYWLSGRAVCELSIATTTQCYDPRRQEWALPLLEAMDLSSSLFPDVVAPGTVLGTLLPAVADEAGVGQVPVIAPACHDTGSAVAAIPAQNPRFAWISSGTWSIMGAEVPEPAINAQTLDYNFTNEGGVDGTWRLSKNIQALWLVQECKRTWARQGEELSYDQITQMAAEAKPFKAVLDPDHSAFLKPGDMPQRIQDYCQRSGQPVPESKGEIVRCALEGIALRYRWVLERLEEILGYRLEPVHIIGGGTKNRLLSQFTADATGRQVIAGPIEATATGNILMQAIALGQLSNLQEAREVVQRSFTPQVFEPQAHPGWDDAYGRMLEGMNRHA